LRVALVIFLALAFPKFGVDQRCQSNNEWATIVDERGFVGIKPYQGAPALQENVMTPGRKPGLYEFVLAPNSTANITMIYDTCEQQSKATFGNNISKFFESFDSRKAGLYKFDSNEQSESFLTGQAIGPSGNDTGGVAVYPSAIKQENEHRVVVTYTITAESKTVSGDYIMTLYHTCPGQLLTIGNKPHQGDIPSTHGTFYGCSF